MEWPNTRISQTFDALPFSGSAVSVCLYNLSKGALCIKVGGITQVFWRSSFRIGLSISHATYIVQKVFGGDEEKKKKKRRWKICFVCVPSVRTAEEENSHSGYTALIISSGLLVACQNQVVQCEMLLGNCDFQQPKLCQSEWSAMRSAEDPSCLSIILI